MCNWINQTHPTFWIWSPDIWFCRRCKRAAANRRRKRIPRLRTLCVCCCLCSALTTSATSAACGRCSRDSSEIRGSRSIDITVAARRAKGVTLVTEKNTIPTRLYNYWFVSKSLKTLN